MSVVTKIVVAAKKFWKEITTAHHETSKPAVRHKSRPHAVHRNQVKP